jgi:LmbE family N-acetylglucosaminyl deacetylase
MRPLRLASPGERLSLLLLGAHADDIEIGVGATILGWISAGVQVDAYWVVLSAMGPRAAEAKTSAKTFLAGAQENTVDIADFKDGFFPCQSERLKEWLENLKARVRPDVIFTHCSDDAHQDHRVVSKLTTNVFRDHLVLEYEIPKWDGDLGRPSLYVPASAAAIDRKIELLMKGFPSQRAKDWFDPETFRGLARLRGLECRAQDRFAEAFHVRKLVLV